MAERQNQEALDRAIRYFAECREHHDEFVEQVEKRYKQYRGILEVTSDAAAWTSKAHPPYIMHIVETSLASMVEDRLRYKITPNASLATYLDPEAAKLARLGAEAHQILFDHQIAQDHFTRLQRPFILQNSIAGLTVAKTFWVQRNERRRRMVNEAQDVFGMMVPNLVERIETVPVYDGPTTEVRDVRDFFYPGNAVSLSKAPYVIDRVWMTPAEVKENFRDGGPFGPDRGGWTLKQVDEAISDSKDSSHEELATRESMLFNVDRTKGLVEIWEVWDNERKSVTVVANRKALLAYRESFPFFHESYPFVVCSTQPDLFRIPGVSQVEKVAHLQTLLWDITNQSIDNLRLINNAIFMFRPDVEDPDAYEFYPGARWFVEDPAQAVPWSPNPLPAEVSLGREALLKGDMQNLAGGFPFSSGTDSQFVDQKTATGASIVSSLAQRSLDLHKQQLYHAWEDIGQQRMVLNQQFIREPVVAPVLGLSDEQEMKLIWPEILMGDYSFKLEPMPSAMMEQEEQAAAQALLTVILQAFPVITAAAQNGSATPINLDSFVEDLLHAFGKDDTARYFSKQAPAMMPPSGGGGMPAAPQAPPQGVTAPGSIDPAVSPSSGVSLSPIASLQRAQALDRS